MSSEYFFFTLFTFFLKSREFIGRGCWTDCSVGHGGDDTGSRRAHSVYTTRSRGWSFRIIQFTVLFLFYYLFKKKKTLFYIRRTREWFKRAQQQCECRPRHRVLLLIPLTLSLLVVRIIIIQRVIMLHV